MSFVRRTGTGLVFRGTKCHGRCANKALRRIRAAQVYGRCLRSDDEGDHQQQGLRREGGGRGRGRGGGGERERDIEIKVQERVTVTPVLQCLKEIKEVVRLVPVTKM